MWSCLELADRLRDPYLALWERLQRSLAEIGVQVLLADGEPFDPEQHDAVGRAPTADPARHLTVANTDFLGYRDHLRAPGAPP